MVLTSEITSLVYNSKEEFESKMKASLVTDTLRQIVSKSMPADSVEKDRLNDPAFREKLNNVLSPVSQEIVNKYQNVSQFDTGNLFASMINSITESVSVESAYRADRIMNDFQLDRISIESNQDVELAVENAFAGVDFTKSNLRTRTVENLKIILSSEDSGEIFDEIRDEVKNAIEETEAKNELVEGTTEEIIDYKKELAPPEDEYVDPENPATEDTGDTDEDGVTEGGDDNGEEGEDGDTSNIDGDEGDTKTEDGSDGDRGENTSDDNGDQSTGEEGNEENDLTLTDDDPESNTDSSAEEPPVDDGDTGETSTDNGDYPLEGEEIPNDKNADGGEGSATSGSNQSGGITINITGADLKVAKESLQNLLTAESFVCKWIPIHGRTFNEVDLPNVNEMASEAANSKGNIAEELDFRFASLEMGLKEYKKASTESNDILTNKYEEFVKRSNEALDKANAFKFALAEMGLSTDGLARSSETAFICAKNVITRFLSKSKKVSKNTLPYTSKENVLTNAFDILQLRQYCKGAESLDPMIAEELFSRENVFYKQLVNFNDPEVKSAATAIIDLTDMKFEKAMTVNFITDYKIKAWEVNVGKNADKDINETVVKRVKDKFEKLYCRELNDEEMEIIKATTNNEDVTEIIPSPYEKFIIKLTRDKIESRESGTGFNITERDAKNIKFKAKLFTTLLKTVEKFNILDNADVREVESFYNSYL